MLVRTLFVIASGAIGYFVSRTPGIDIKTAVGIIVGAGWGVLVVLLELILARISWWRISGAWRGMFFGVFSATLFYLPIYIAFRDNAFAWIGGLGVNLIFGYVGACVGWRGWFTPGGVLSAETRAGELKLLDTSAIIDGRIADICQTGFMEGTLIIPRFVLRELQTIADSTDPLKRKRGRRGKTCEAGKTS